ncbi:MAG: hypothetical protein ACODUE_02200 [Synechococcus sp.]
MTALASLAAQLLNTLAALALAALLAAAPAWAADLQVKLISLEPCPAADAAAQSDLRRPIGASCWALRATVDNPGRQAVVDTDMFGRVVDASGESVLPNRTRLGSIGDVPPGVSEVALRLSVPAGTAGPLQVGQLKARGFRAPVRARVRDDQELLPLEEALADS